MCTDYVGILRALGVDRLVFETSRRHVLTSSLIASALIAGLLCVILLLAMRPIAVSLKLVDKPGGRKRHVGHVPIIGGLAMYCGFVIGSIIAPGAEAMYLLVGASILVFVGVIDDRYDLPATVRLGAQICAVLVMVFGGGLVVDSLGDPIALGEIRTGGLALPFTVFLVVAVLNAINMTDGTDGLAGTLSLVALTALAIAGFGTSVAHSAMIGIAVVVGFLAFNFPIKLNRSIRTFMGDAGSTFLGFLIAWLCVQLTQRPVASVPPIAALGFVAIPLYDLTSCVVRRILDGRSPMSADRNHFHHVLQEAGLKRRQILAVLGGAACAIAAASLVLAKFAVSDARILVFWCACGIAVDASLRGFRRYRAHSLAK